MKFHLNSATKILQRNSKNREGLMKIQDIVTGNKIHGKTKIQLALNMNIAVQQKLKRIKEMANGQNKKFWHRRRKSKTVTWRGFIKPNITKKRELRLAYFFLATNPSDQLIT